MEEKIQLQSQWQWGNMKNFLIFSLKRGRKTFPVPHLSTSFSLSLSLFLSYHKMKEQKKIYSRHDFRLQKFSLSCVPLSSSPWKMCVMWQSHCCRRRKKRQLRKLRLQKSEISTMKSNFLISSLLSSLSFQFALTATVTTAAAAGIKNRLTQQNKWVREREEMKEGGENLYTKWIYLSRCIFSHANIQFRREDKCEEGAIYVRTHTRTYSNFTFEKNYNNFFLYFFSLSLLRFTRSLAFTE